MQIAAPLSLLPLILTVAAAPFGYMDDFRLEVREPGICASNGIVVHVTGQACLQMATSAGFIPDDNAFFPQNNGVCVGRQAMGTSYYFGREGNCYQAYSPTPRRPGAQFAKPPGSGSAKGSALKPVKGPGAVKNGQKPGGRGGKGKM
ncbi:hypothetical protein BKA70DRAFT_1393995 [Coprinopsis sp. MPI-PUGE-AT-0042]|nr:hypothetical protein BKA70DRAFT_1393995 [Coprinopsis sp. MPI-PUGE-AT-0042]